MKSFKNVISFVVLASFVFLIPLKTNALTIEEVIKNLNNLQPSNISNIKDAINYYDYQESIDEISSIIDESLNSSKDANEKLDKLNTLMNSINDKNKDLLIIKDKKEYDSAIDALKEEVEIAKQINSSAKTSSQEGLDKYNEAIEKYASLKSVLEDKKAKTEAILNTNIMATNAKLDAINSLLEELVKHEDKLKEVFNEANKAYNSAKENALEELEELENLKTENDFDLSDLESKIKEAEDALVNINNDVEVTINDYVEVKEENTESDNKPTSDNTDVDVKNETETSKSDKNDSSKEEKVEIKDSTEETYEEESENRFNWLNLLWLLPIAIILFFIIFFIKRRKEEE